MLQLKYHWRPTLFTTWKWFCNHLLNSGHWNWKLFNLPDIISSMSECPKGSCQNLQERKQSTSLGLICNHGPVRVEHHDVARHCPRPCSIPHICVAQRPGSVGPFQVSIWPIYYKRSHRRPRRHRSCARTFRRLCWLVRLRFWIGFRERPIDWLCFPSGVDWVSWLLFQQFICVWRTHSDCWWAVLLWRGWISISISNSFLAITELHICSWAAFVWRKKLDICFFLQGNLCNTLSCFWQVECRIQAVHYETTVWVVKATPRK